jgi:hypothetical protein
MKLSESSTAAWSDSVLFPRTPRYKQTRLWTWGRQTWLGEISRASKKFGHEMWSWLSYEKVSLPSVAKLAESIAILQNRGFDTTNFETAGEAPIFVLSNGGRAGSTLLQRILITDPRLLIWGEPQGEMALVSRLAEMVSDLEQPLKLLTWKNQVDANSPALAQSWIATLYPSITYFRAALRGIFDQWLGKPARERGYMRWGFKEVRLGATEAMLLHWLYPNAKFVITCRHPYDSYKSFVGNRWVLYYRYPRIRVDSAVAFAHHWDRLATSWYELPADFPCFRMKYEDLVHGKVDFRKLESWLGIEIKEDVALSAPVGGSRQRGRVTWYERMIIAHEAEAGMRALGYSK